jgi:hypothetical protein
MHLIATIELDQSFSKDFDREVIKEIVKKIKQQAERIRSTVTLELQRYVREALVSAPEYQSILQGKLRAELGIPNPDVRIMTIVDTWVNNIKVKVEAGSSPFLTVDIGMIQEDYGDVLSLPGAAYEYESYRGGGVIPWLEWLLLEGDRRIVNRYEFTSNVTRNSRTGMGIMISKRRGSWQVPPEYSGTSADNFALRALSGVETAIDQIIEKAIKGAFK